MPFFEFPSLPASARQTTLETLFHYARALGAIRRAASPRQKHWAHVSLRVNATGLTTTPIPAESSTFELALDLTAHAARLATSRGGTWQTRLRGQAPTVFREELAAALAAFGLSSTATRLNAPDSPGGYDPAHVEAYWRALSQIALLLEQFRGELREETAPVQFWPHHADLALLWFSGRLVPGQNPADEENADEQMNFGFSPGEAGSPDPYFYVTAYPLPAGWVGSPLPAGAQWHTTGWTGALLPYGELERAADPASLLFDFWRTTRAQGADRMRQAAR